MASIETPPPAALQPAPITCVQPGGGWGMRLELLWGRLRRAWLRAARPGYVSRMAGLRQGACPDCPHDIIDSRDLKFYRNVCGYSFRPADDAFRWRDYLGLARMGLVEVVVVTGLCGIAALLVGSAALWVHPWFGLLFFLLFALWTFLVTFFRDPTRTIPTAADVLVSPADGTVTHIDDSADADFPGGKAVRISIFLSIFNVHVNRAPRAGRVVEVRYFPGEFLDARHPRCGVANEQLWIDLDDSASGRRLRIKQISGKLARRIVCWLKPGDLVQRGERFGMIKFGSRTEVCVPADLVAAVQVKVGDKVKGGSTVLVRLAVSTLV